MGLTRWTTAFPCITIFFQMIMDLIGPPRSSRNTHDVVSFRSLRVRAKCFAQFSGRLITSLLFVCDLVGISR
jgi:hypothetical protein